MRTKRFPQFSVGAAVPPAIRMNYFGAAAIMMGEKAAEMVAADHGVKLAEFVGEHLASRLRFRSQMRDSLNAAYRELSLFLKLPFLR